MNELKSRVNWRGVYQRLADDRRTLEGRTGLDDPYVQERLRERAEQLALRGTGRRQRGPTRRVVVFMVENQRLAFDLNLVVKVMRLEKYAPVPGGPAGLLGVGNFDGGVRSVIDMRPLLGMTPPFQCRPAYALLLRWQQTESGVAADAIVQVAEFSEEQIRHPEGAAAELLSWSYGVGPHDTVLLDAERMLAGNFERPAR